MAKAKKKKKKKKIKLTPAQKAQQKTKNDHFKEIRTIFSTCGFSRIPSVAGEHVTFDGTTSEFDELFVFENVIVAAECTTSQPSGLSEHLKKKKVFYDKILANVTTFVSEMDAKFPDFKNARNSKYQIHQLHFIIVYCSRYTIKKELKAEVPDIKYLDYHIARYFKTITDRVKKSARFELFNFLSLSYKDIGENVFSTAGIPSLTYKGSILPEGQSHFPAGYKVVSFYVDPAALLQRCYVLRKDGWIDDGGTYQRMISRKKIESIRKYLLKEKRVFINNIIVTLPDTTLLTKSDGQTLNPATIQKTEPGNIQLPAEYNSIGLIDGQHRVFSYYEGGKDEGEISALRIQQNLLATGVIYPSGILKSEKSKFEATLFLEINSTQTNARSDLKQSIGILLNPFSLDSIARMVVDKLNDDGPLNEEFERYFFDKGKLKVTSIVSYGVRPLIRFSGADTLFNAWTHASKQTLVDSPNETIALEYVDFCATEISKFVGAVKASLPKDRWTADKKVTGRMLTTTIVNGLAVCVRRLSEHKKLHAFEWYKEKLATPELSKFQFSSYKSSQYGSLGQALYDKYFAN